MSALTRELSRVEEEVGLCKAGLDARATVSTLTQVRPQGTSSSHRTPPTS